MKNAITFLKAKAFQIAGTVAVIGMGALSAKADYSTTTISSGLSSSLNATVQAIIGTAFSFITDNLPLISVFSVGIGLVFWFIQKVRKGAKGK